MDLMIFLVIASYFIVFSFGFIVSYLSRQQTVYQINQQQLPTVEKPTSFLSKATSEREQKTSSENKSERVNRKIEIDDRKFITEVKTDSLEKKFNELGKKTVALDEGLSANVSKLASLKKSKED